jgi:hypothetical protein
MAERSEKKKHKRRLELDSNSLHVHVHVSVGTPQTASDLGSITDVFEDNLSAPS